MRAAAAVPGRVRIGSVPSIVSVVAFASLLAPAPARADSVLPPARGRAGGEGRDGRDGRRTATPSWAGRCAERFERARAEAAQRAPALGAGQVEAVAREQGAPGDPSAQTTVDVVEYQLGIGNRLVYLARVQPRRDEGTEATPWTPSAVRNPGEGDLGRPGPASATLYAERAAGTLHGTLLASDGDRAALRVFEAAFKRAVDDCLRGAAPVDAAVARGASAAARVTPGPSAAAAGRRAP